MRPYGIRREKLGELIGSERLAEEMIEAGWLKPIVQEKKLTLFSMVHVARAFARLESEGRPKVTSRTLRSVKLRAYKAAKDAKAFAATERDDLPFPGARSSSKAAKNAKAAQDEPLK